MKIVEYVAAVLAFRSIPTTILAVLIYIAVFASVLVTDQLASIPKNQQGLNLTEAYADLHQVAQIPHPYNSHANDAVRSYILSRVNKIADSYQHVHVDSDMKSNFTTNTVYDTYFEGTNILVKIDGSDPSFQNKGGLTLSAHYDSVSTAPGTTDDGMGVVTLIQMVKYLAERRPKRTVVFNINNGEEDWLNGARAYIEHPWSNITDTFINLEGAASGGRPILFRATSTFPVKSFAKNVLHPHGNVLSADAFARGVIRSGTDYSVYTSVGMRGLDFAFYKGRSMYHTKYDSIPYTVGLEKALWAMMETARDSAIWLANADKDEGRGLGTEVGLGEMGDEPVYFDLFGAIFFVFPLSVLYIVNIVLLAAGPLLLLIFLAGGVILQHRRRRRIEENYSGRTAVNHTWIHFKSLGWAKGLWKWSKFWLALFITVGLQIPLIIGFIKLNPYVIYSNPMLPMISSFALAYLTLVLTFALPVPGPLTLPERQKQTSLLQTYVLTWAFLLAATITIDRVHVGGLYWITVWNALVWLGCILGYIEGMFAAHGSEGDIRVDAVDADIVDSQEHEPVPRSRFESNSEVQRAESERDEDEQVEAEEVEASSERTPLLGQKQFSERLNTLIDDDGEDGGAIGWWIFQILIVIPIPVTLIAHIAVILLGALPQTLADGNSATTVYASFSFLSVLFIIPLAPFAVKMHRSLTYAFITAFLLTTLWSWFLSAPFDTNSPLKVFFQQTVDLDSNITLTRLTGIPAYLKHGVVSELPSAQGKNVNCKSVGKDDKKNGLDLCTWESGERMLPSSGVVSKKGVQWMNVHTYRNSTDAIGQITITPQNSRNCRVYFDGSGISAWKVHESGSTWTTAQQGTNLKEIRLWSRTWSKEFIVNVKWSNYLTGKLSGRVACEWAEYESGAAGLEVSKELTLAKIPALEEVLRFLPKWAVVSKSADGLVEVSRHFEV